MADQITSFSNPLIKRVKRLRQKKYRQQEGFFFVEGLRVVMSAVEAVAPIETILYCPELLTSDIAWDVLRQQDQSGSRLQAVSAPVFASISGRDNPVGLGAIVRAKWTELADLSAGASDIFVALFEAAEPGNLGTILRTMDAVGARGAILVGDSVDPFHPSAVKASMGALFSISVSQTTDSETLFSWAGSQGLMTVASSARGSTPYDEAAPAIGMAGAASSLNLAVAAGLLLYEIRRTSAA